MATASATTKKKCEFWDKCYRKNKQHKEEFLHPSDVEETKKEVQPKPRLVHEISAVDDEDDLHPTSTLPKATTLAGSKRKTDGDKTSDSDIATSSSSSFIPPLKKVKFDNTDEEKISVDYNKKKANSNTNVQTTNSSDKGDASKAGADTTGTIATANTTQTIQYKSRKEKCKYWDKCYQTNQSHKDEFYHPGDDIPADFDDGKKTRGQTSTPLNALPDGGSVQFDSGYTLKREGDIYSCSCKGFLIQRAPINERTCKHLKEYLGEQFEKARVEKNTKPKKAHISSHINISLLLAHKYEEKTTDPRGWWISEKLDGVRAFWNGRCFYSRLGNAFYAPEWFTKDLPKDIHLDGELFGGRGQFQSTVSIVKTAESPKWKDIKYHVFDAPHMGKEVFEKRMNTIKEYFEENEPEYAVFVEQTKCKSKEHLEAKLTKVLNIGGEGLMIRQPKSIYEGTRSRTLLKIKKFYDAEAIVIAHERGKGVNQNRCGALRCRMACGKEFSVGSGMTDKNRNNPPKIGSIITYKFQELSKSGTPRFPTFVGVRLDKTEPEDAEIRPVLNEEDA
ncbi:DNA ligase [Plakobranchus ocellatus]|uniref:DNA ligase n=1 Tax=Plakobranchus ocellatus TaxID=259542 RepID=A0AAV4BP24_9GAST|nr:DNA ligase [Plakobranchus ocellatus]